MEMDITISTKAKAKMIIFCYNYRDNQESEEIMEVLGGIRMISYWKAVISMGRDF
ncbi:hypothetical protein [Megasphaera elsdenii]|uniref:hypothetical protein n=1 Tax=Megasphaera elsdenii TaxID=907 RepID=UPI00242EF68C|nr:hypothetical protein [Megasphaera elsdenii]